MIGVKNQGTANEEEHLHILFIGCFAGAFKQLK